MSEVIISNNVSLKLDNDEKEVLSRAYEVLVQLRHELFLQADDSEKFWTVDAAMYNLKDILYEAGVVVEY